MSNKFLTGNFSHQKDEEEESSEKQNSGITNGNSGTTPDENGQC